MSNNIRHPRQLLRPTAQRTDLVSNELLDLVVPRRSNHFESGLLSRLNSDIGQGKVLAAGDRFNLPPSTDLGEFKACLLQNILRELILRSTPEVSLQHHALLKQLLVA